MTQVITLQEIKPILEISSLIETIEEGMQALVEGSVVLPPVTHLPLELGDVHIKSAAYKNGEIYAIKVASSFEGKTDGMILLFSQKTGHPIAILLDEGYLTEFRTGIAGAICAKRFAPKKIKAIGIVGTGNQAYFQLKVLKELYPEERFFVWGRSLEKAEKFAKQHHILLADDLDILTQSCNLIVTTTSAEKPLLFASQIHAGTHITAMGSDQQGKQELDPALLQNGRVFVDSLEQCLAFGEASHAQCSPIELLKGKRESENEITIADLTGVGIQDLAIATYVYNKWRKNHGSH